MSMAEERIISSAANSVIYRDSNSSFNMSNTELSNMSLYRKPAKPRLLLHACCGPCATACVERMVPDYSVTVFYYNPNITDSKEYYLRKENLEKFIHLFNEEYEGRYYVDYIAGTYDPERYIQYTEALAAEPEGGKRCNVCFEMRLAETAKRAREGAFDCWTTTMTVSPHKNYALITETGKRLAQGNGTDYLDVDFKKKNGFGRSVELSRKYGLYRQRFCGCEYARGSDK